MNTAEKLDKVNAELDTLRAEYKRIGNQVTRKVKQQEKLLLELNQDNLKDPEWLIRNPTMPGAHEGMKQLVQDLYGGEYNGPHPSGYIHDGKYNPIQKNFDLWLKNYGKEDNRAQVKQNCDHFVENFLPMLDAVTEIKSRWDNQFPKVKVVPLQFSSEDHGVDCLGYEPTEAVWYHYSLVYGRTDIKQKFNSWDEAFDFAYAMSNQPSNEYEDEDY